MLYNILLAVFVLISVALVALILLQQGKGADAGAAFGSGASGTVFGSRGSASFLTRTTGILAALFFIISLSLAYLSNQQIEPTSVVEQVQQQEAARFRDGDVQAIQIVTRLKTSPTTIKN